jgi:hypothetical protein
MKRFSLLMGVAVFAALSLLTAFKVVAPAPSAPPILTNSIQDLHRQVDVKSLPQQETADLY